MMINRTIILGVSFLFSCSNTNQETKKGNRPGCVITLEKELQGSKVGQIIDLNIGCITYDKIVILSDEVNFTFLSKEVNLEENSIGLLNENSSLERSGTWSIIYLQNDKILSIVDFDHKALRMNNLVNNNGYGIFEKKQLKKITVIKTEDVFMDKRNTPVYDVKPD